MLWNSLSCWSISLWSLIEITFSIVKFCLFLPLAIPDTVFLTVSGAELWGLALWAVRTGAYSCWLLPSHLVIFLLLPDSATIFILLSALTVYVVDGLLLFENKFCAVPWPAWNLVLGQASLGLQQSRLCLSVGTAALCHPPSLAVVSLLSWLKEERFSKIRDGSSTKCP